MNRKIGMLGAAVNICSVLGFALSMAANFLFGCYLCSMFIALSFVPMICALGQEAAPERRAAGWTAAAFAAAYAAIILLVYFAQLTVVRLDSLTPQARSLLDFQQMGLFFSFDLLGYALMALSTLFAGLTLSRPSDRALKILLTAHGAFFLPCLVVPMLGLFQADGPAWVGTALLEIWCAYFLPIGILSFRHFRSAAAK